MSTLSTAVQDYLSLRRRLGFKLREEGTLLPDFVAFLERQGASHITTELALQWALQPADTLPSHWATRLRMVRLFATHWSATDPRTEVPPPGLLPYRYHRKPPHIYTDDPPPDPGRHEPLDMEGPAPLDLRRLDRATRGDGDARGRGHQPQS